MDNEHWAESIIRRTDSSFQHRWVVYKSRVQSLLRPDCIWVDIGSGPNEMVSLFGSSAGIAVGVDAYIPEELDSRSFLQADARSLPFAENSVDRVTLRFVVEHFENPTESLKEIARVLKPGGKALILTTNARSPFVFLPRLLPYRIKNKIISRLFKVSSEDVFPTYHRLNTRSAFEKLTPLFAIEEFAYLSDLNYTRRWIFRILLLLHLTSRLPGCGFLRANILCILTADKT